MKREEKLNWPVPGDRVAYEATFEFGRMAKSVIVSREDYIARGAFQDGGERAKTEHINTSKGQDEGRRDIHTWTIFFSHQPCLSDLGTRALAAVLFMWSHGELETKERPLLG